jgi:hypothetical protein
MEAEMKVEFHPVANLFPLMEGESFAEFCKDIQSHGLIEPIWLHDGKIIDGRNRYRACEKTGVPPVFRKWNGQGSLVEFIFSLNFHRRQLSPGQMAACGAEYALLQKAEAKERQRLHGGTAPGIGKESLPTQMEEVIDPRPKGQVRSVHAKARIYCRLPAALRKRKRQIAD